MNEHFNGPVITTTSRNSVCGSFYLLFGRSECMKISQNLASVAHTTTYTATIIALEPSSSFIPITLQCDVIDVNWSGEIQNTLNVC